MLIKIFIKVLIAHKICSKHNYGLRGNSPLKAAEGTTSLFSSCVRSRCSPPPPSCFVDYLESIADIQTVYIQRFQIKYKLANTTQITHFGIIT